MKYILIILFSISVYSQTYIIPLSNAEITDALQGGRNLSDSLVLHKKHSGSAFSPIDTLVFGGYSLTPFYNRGVVGAQDLSLQGKFQINKGLNILPDSYYGYSNLNLYQGGGTEPTLGMRGLGGINFNYYDTTNHRYQPLMQLGVDVAASLTTDGLPPFFFIGARDSLNITNDLFGIVMHDYTPSGVGNLKRYRGTFLFNSMGLASTTVGIATHNKQPNRYSLLRLHRTIDDSTNSWLWFTHGTGGIATFLMNYTGNMTWYNPTNGSYAYLTGDGSSINFSNNNNNMEIQSGALQFRGGTFTTLPNRTDWDSPTFTAIMNNTGLLPFENNAGIKLRNTNNTTGNNFSIYNNNYADVTNASISFVNVDQTSKGAITFNTKDTDTQGERIKINESGHLILKALETDISASQMTANDVAIYLKDDKLKISYLIDGGVRTKALNLINSDSVFIIEDTLGTELASNKSLETLISGTLDDGITDDWLDWAEPSGSGLVEAVTGSKFNNGVMLTNNTGSAYTNLGVQENISVTAGTNYRLTFWTKGDGTNSGAHRIYDNTHAANIVASTLGNNSISGTTWTQKSVDFTTPAGCTNVLIYLFGHTTNGSVIYYDSVSLKEIL